MTTLSSLVSLLILSTAALAQTATIPIVDKSAPDSPLANTGTVTVVENDNGDTATLSFNDNWTATNKSSKSIIAVVETLVVHYPNGNSDLMQSAYDAFFSRKNIEPGGAMNLSSPADMRKAEPIRSAFQIRPPSDEAVVRWIQFEDGTTFGDGAYAKDLVANRAAVLRDLKALDQVYVRQGSEEFARQVQRTIPQDGYIDQFRRLQAREGTQAAIDEIRMKLAAAEARTELWAKN